VIKIKTTFNASRVNKVLAQVPATSANVVYTKALPAAAKVAMSAAKQRAPRSASTGSADRQSAKSQAIWGVRPLAELIHWKVVRVQNAVSFALIGPMRPWGNKINFVAPFKKVSKRVKLWGRDPTNVPAEMPKSDRFMEQAADETRGEQQRAFVGSLVKYARRELRKLRG
jgi:hypothetical protein